ncbi:MAG: heparan-alpha-glucosaminide N-acetyltransferase domain-containing protein [Ignavibacteria bacterium]|nr:heparan-alpha-glucosaminide N-acetyltransferase domain-containing protein [Ignavibacteria bacterium]
MQSERQTGSAPGHRIQFIDLLRGWAVIVMIETHVFNASLSSGITDGDPFQILKFINGLVAPAFLFASGLAYAVTTHRKIADYLSFGPKLFRHLGRLLFIIVVGYVMHLPKFSLRHLLTLTEAWQWDLVYQVDILQCIGVSLLIMQMLLLVLRSEKRLYIALGVLTGLLLAITPFAWAVDSWAILLPPIAEYVNGMHHSQFPLFPWSAFLFAGSITGYWYIRAGRTKPDTTVSLVLTGTAAVLIVSAVVLEPIASWVYPVYDYWRFSPTFVFLRLGLVFVLTAGMSFYEKHVGVGASSPVTLIGRQSLLVYVAHLFLIYGDFGVYSFQRDVGNTFGYLQALAVTAALLLLMYLLAAVWEYVRARGPRFTRRVQLVALAILVTLFLFTPA